MPSTHLPFFGFDNGQTYDVLKSENRLLFRIHTDQPHEQFGLVSQALRGNEGLLLLPFGIQGPKTRSVGVVSHIAPKATNYRSPWVSCTFSIAYIIWQGLLRKMQHSRNQDMDFWVSIIQADHPLLDGRAEHCVQKLEALKCSRQHIFDGDEWRGAKTMQKYNIGKACNFANASQEVLVATHIPAQAILTTISWK